MVLVSNRELMPVLSFFLTAVRAIWKPSCPSPGCTATDMPTATTAAVTPAIIVVLSRFRILLCLLHTRAACLTGVTLRNDHSAQAPHPVLPYESNPIRRAPIVTLVHNAIEVMPTTFGLSVRKCSSSFYVMIRGMTNVRITPMKSASIFHQKNGL